MEQYFTVNFLKATKVYKYLNYKHKRCFLCSKLVTNDFALCFDCIADLPFNTHYCSICSKSLKSSSICGDCLTNQKTIIDRTVSIFQYKYPINQLLVRFKFNQGLIVGDILGKLMATKLLSESHDIDYIVPVPLFYKRLISRGYNQATCLARPIASELNLPIKQDLCCRVVDTKNQTSLNAQQRNRNVRNAFQINGSVQGKKIALVDDVITTGSTLQELAKTFKAAGASTVQAWCCAIREN